MAEGATEWSRGVTVVVQHSAVTEARLETDAAVTEWRALRQQAQALQAKLDQALQQRTVAEKRVDALVSAPVPTGEVRTCTPNGICPGPVYGSAAVHF